MPAGTHQATRTFVLLNPGAGQADTGGPEGLARRISGLMAGDGNPPILHRLEQQEDLGEVVGRAIDEGADRVVAAGGDGTVAAVAARLAGTGVPLGIIPLGTANVLARELEIPFDLDAACRVLAGPSRRVSIDAMEIAGRLYFTQVEVGVGSLMIRDTDTQAKKRFGRAAYMWKGLVSLLGFQPRRFAIGIDGGAVRFVRASDIVVANVGAMGAPGLRWGPDIRPDDGRLSVCIIRARHLGHYLVSGWHVLRGTHRSDPNTSFLDARSAIEIAMRTAGSPLPVQADGEIVGETPVRVELSPRVLDVIVPEAPGDAPG
jgi:YegS/Rv2252/BmrU family lipid kinase